MAPLGMAAGKRPQSSWFSISPEQDETNRALGFNPETDAPTDPDKMAGMLKPVGHYGWGGLQSIGEGLYNAGVWSRINQAREEQKQSQRAASQAMAQFMSGILSPPPSAPRVTPAVPQGMAGGTVAVEPAPQARTPSPAAAQPTGAVGVEQASASQSAPAGMAAGTPPQPAPQQNGTPVPKASAPLTLASDPRLANIDHNIAGMQRQMQALAPLLSNPATRQQGMAMLQQAQQRIQHFEDQKLTMSDPRLQAQQRLTELEIATRERELNSPAAKIGAFKEGETPYVVDPRAPGGIRFLEVPNQGGAQNTFNKEFAKHAPGYLMKAQEAYSMADQAVSLTSDMEKLAPHIYSGSWAGVQNETAKILNKLGADYKGVAPTELFHSMAQKFVGIEGQKYKPLSNSDVAFIEKGLPTLGRDPSSIPHMLGAMKAVAQRDRLAKQIEMEELKRGRAPDFNAIAAQVNAQIPSYTETLMNGATAGTRPADTKGPTPAGARLPEGWSIQRVK